MAKAREKGEIRSQEEEIECIMFDARIDLTKVRHFDEETEKFFPRVEKADHYTMTDGSGRYLHHFTKQGKTLEEEHEDDMDEVDHDDRELRFD